MHNGFKRREFRHKLAVCSIAVVKLDGRGKAFRRRPHQLPSLLVDRIPRLATDCRFDLPVKFVCEARSCSDDAGFERHGSSAPDELQSFAEVRQAPVLIAVHLDFSEEAGRIFGELARV